jgi:transposase InsO family protein
VLTDFGGRSLRQLLCGAFSTAVAARSVTNTCSPAESSAGRQACRRNRSRARRDRHGLHLRRHRATTDSRKLVHPSDAGSQCTSFRFAQHLVDAGIDASIGTVGDALDNALAESTIGLFKAELVKQQGRGTIFVKSAPPLQRGWIGATIVVFTEPVEAGHRSSTRPCTSGETWSVWSPDPDKESLPNPGRFIFGGQRFTRLERCRGLDADEAGDVAGDDLFAAGVFERGA